MAGNPTKRIGCGENMGKKMNDLKCVIIQKAVYTKLYKGHRPNEWGPWRAPGVTTLPSGLVCRNDIQFSDAYPNSFADIWYADDSHAKRPTIVYFHGGGFIFGDKSSGDPMQAAGGGVGKLESMVAAGYNLVNANYALSPEYRFPAQIHQTDQLFRFLLAHESELGLDMSRVALSGGSAGANITEIYAACVCNPKYAALLGIEPVMSRENLKVLAIDEAALDASVFDKNMFTMLGCWTGAKANDSSGEFAVINAKNYIHDVFIPSWINASNEPDDERGFFSTEAQGLKRKLDEIGVPNDMVFFPGAKLPHGYMDQMDSEPHAREAFMRMMSFIQKYI